MDATFSTNREVIHPPRADNTLPTNPSEEARSERERFDAEVFSVLYSKGSEMFSIFAFIQRTLGQFRLKGVVDIPDVFNEAYMRGVEAINSGKKIAKPIAWLRATAFNIIRELSREWKERQKVSPDLLECSSLPLSPQDETLSTEDLEYRLKAVWRAFQELSQQDREVLRLRMFENLSWKEISDRLTASGEFKSEEAFRVHGHRAIKRLRAKYHSLVEDQIGSLESTHN